MRIQKDGLDPGQHAVVAVEVSPAGLHHADLRLGEVVDHLHQPVGLRDKVGVEHGHELALGHLKAGIQRSGLVAVTIGAVNVSDGVAQSRIARHNGGGHLLSFVGRVVQHLNIQFLARILHGADRLNQPVDDELLVEDGQLHGHARQLREVLRGVRMVVLLEFVVVVAHGVTMNAVVREGDHHREVRQQHRQIKPVPVVKSLERLLIGILHLQCVEQAAMRRKGQICGERHGRPMQLAGDRIQTVGKGRKQGEPPRLGYRQL